MDLSTLTFQPSTRPQAETIGGYYQPDDKKTSAALRPSPTLNQILATL